MAEEDNFWIISLSYRLSSSAISWGKRSADRKRRKKINAVYDFSFGSLDTAFSFFLFPKEYPHSTSFPGP
jgi:hypothetical protein